MKKILVLFLVLLLTVANTASVLATTSTTLIPGDTNPKSVIETDIKAQNNNDTATYLSIRSDKEEAPECQSFIKSINQNQPELNVMKDVTSAKLLDMKELTVDYAATMTNISQYKQTWSDVKAYYVAIDYTVKKESRWFYNGINYRLIVLGLENNNWVILEESMAPVENIVAAGKGFGTNGICQVSCR